MAGLQIPDITQIGTAGRRFVEDRRNDERYGLEQQKMAATSADIGRQQETASLDHEYDMYKRDMQRGLQSFGTDPMNYQDAVDTINNYYGNDARITHRTDPTNPANITYDLEVTDPKTGERKIRTGMTKDDLGQTFMMSLNPAGWFQHKVDVKEASEVAKAKQQSELEQIDREGAWDVMIERIKAGLTGGGTGLTASESLTLNKEVSDLAKEAWGQLNDEGLFSGFVDEWNADYAAMNAKYADTLTRSGDRKYRNNPAQAHERALAEIRQQREIFKARLLKENPEMDEQLLNDTVRDMVREYIGALEYANRPADGGETRQKTVQENWPVLEEAMRAEGVSEDQIQEKKKKYGIEEDEEEPVAAAPVKEKPAPEQKTQLGLQEKTEAMNKGAAKTAQVIEAGKAAPAETTTTGLTETPAKAPEQASAPATEPQKLESEYQKGILEKLEAPITFGKGGESSNIDWTADRGESGKMESQIKEARKGKGYKNIQTGKQEYAAREGDRLTKLRADAARRVTEAYHGGAPIQSRVILEAALNSGKLNTEVAQKVKAALSR